MTDENLNDFMHGFITDICENIGPRASASEEEKAAGDKIENILKNYCNKTYQEEFSFAPKAFIGFIRYGALMVVISVVLYWISLMIDFNILGFDSTLNLILLFISVLLVTFALAYFILEVMLQRELLDFLFPKKTAKNIIEEIEPKEEVKNNLLICAHHDSAYQFNLFYYFKTFGAVLIFVGFIGVIVSSVFIWLKFLAFFIPSILNSMWFLRFGFTLLIYIPVGILFMFFISKNAVPGAYDNLSGVAILLALAKFYSDNQNNSDIFPKNTKITLDSLACEEAGLRGSRRYVASHEKELINNKTKVINIDSISMKDKIVIVNKETLLFVKHNQKLSDELLEIGNQFGIGIKFGSLPFGGSDAVPFTWKKIPATSFMTFDFPKMPSYYHTRNDKPKVVEKESLGQVLDICVEYIKQTDGGA